jgi:hypothetical protein
LLIVSLHYKAETGSAKDERVVEVRQMVLLSLREHSERIAVGRWRVQITARRQPVSTVKLLGLLDSLK